MLTVIVYLSASWFAVALLLALATGARIRHAGAPATVAWLVLLIVLGDVVVTWVWGLVPVAIPASLCVFLLGLGVTLKTPEWNAPGRALFLFGAAAAGLYLLDLLAAIASAHLAFAPLFFSLLVFSFTALVLLLALTFLFEIVDVACRTEWHRVLQPGPLLDPPPLVSLRVPIHDEPVQVVERTLRSLARLDYPRYQVLVVDDNTLDENLWQPVQDLCCKLGFQFVHLEHWPGYKAGALNYALGMTEPAVEIVGVVDADSVIDPDYLKRTVPFFSSSQLGLLQTRLDYAGQCGDRFFLAARDLYDYFYQILLPSRNERNAISFTGTLGLLRLSALREVGGWDEWCLTEDAEVSLRILNRGYDSLYLRDTFGRGLVPPDLQSLKSQHLRWVFGGMQILRMHWNRLMPWGRWWKPQDQLTGAQRYFYLVDSLQWLYELARLLFTLFLFVGIGLTIVGAAGQIAPVIGALIVVPLVLFGTDLVRWLWALPQAMSVSWKRTTFALALSFALSWITARACVEGIFRKEGTFLRTPRLATRSGWRHALASAGWETLIGAACLLAGLGVALAARSWYAWALAADSCLQAAVYLSAPLMAFLATARSGS